jgi:hypothetical protein
MKVADLGACAAVCILLSAGFLAGHASALDRSVQRREPSQLVLRAQDVGGSYLENRQGSFPHKFAFVAAGDSSSVRHHLLEKMWTDGYQRGFNGTSVPWGIVSSVDRFTTTGLSVIGRAWRAGFLRILHGRSLTLPHAAPGTSRLLIRGSLAGAAIYAYVWQQGATISQVNLAGRVGPAQLPLLMRLARIQAARISAGA